ncbi:uncharacterized protein LOC119669748 isoform X2 [Teleopsis dalmanni]|nr:uncharacterized protein LOC119669748 isoform X2 [Teleopsis dalmanni]
MIVKSMKYIMNKSKSRLTSKNKQILIRTCIGSLNESNIEVVAAETQTIHVDLVSNGTQILHGDLKCDNHQSRYSQTVIDVEAHSVQATQSMTSKANQTSKVHLSTQSMQAEVETFNSKTQTEDMEHIDYLKTEKTENLKAITKIGNLVLSNTALLTKSSQYLEKITDLINLNKRFSKKESQLLEACKFWERRNVSLKSRKRKKRRPKVYIVKAAPKKDFKQKETQTVFEIELSSKATQTIDFSKKKKNFFFF